MNGMEKATPILVIPYSRSGSGGGHLARCRSLVQNFAALGVEAYLYSHKPEAADESIPHINETEALAVPSWRFIVIDGFRTDVGLYSKWASRAPLVGIDEGGPCRNRFDYLLDILPGPKRFSLVVRLLSLSAPLSSCQFLFRILCRAAGAQDRANLAQTAFLTLPEKLRQDFPAEIDFQKAFAWCQARKGEGSENPRAIRILVSFGAEDKRGLSIPVVQGLLDFIPGDWITLVIGPKNRVISQEERTALASQGVQILESPSGLAETLYHYDLLITHFGLTAFEALAARLPVALVSPTGYHEVLSLSAGFYSFGYGRRAAVRAGRLLVKKSQYQKILEMSREAAHRHIPPQKEPLSLAAAMSRWTFPGQSRCPLCHDRQPRHRKVLARFPERTYFRCKTCGITYMSRPNEPPITYDGAYFLEDYKKQYGKTYIEDFPNLIRMAQARIERIQSLLSHQKSPEEPVRLLDIGCAYGPFLAAGRNLGWAVRGLDPSSDAVRYVQDHVGVPVLQGLFPETDLSPLTDGQAMDAVTLWYVIEHFQDLGKALEGAAALLKKGGILAISTPSGSGVSGRARPHSFLEHSPPDHWTIWSPATCGPILKRFGFRLVKTVSTGHHPERFPLLGPFAKSQKTVIYRVLYRISQLFALGDTFEAYAVKE